MPLHRVTIGRKLYGVFAAPDGSIIRVQYNNSVRGPRNLILTGKTARKVLAAWRATK